MTKTLQRKTTLLTTGAAALAILGLLMALPAPAQMGPGMGGPGQGGPGMGGPGMGPGTGGPQGPAPGPGQQGPPLDQILKETLGFTDQQLTALQALLDGRRTAVEAHQQQLAEAHRTLAELLQASSPDPAAVGQAFLQVRSLEKQMATIAEAFRTGFASLLTAEQKQRLEEIAGLARALQAAEALRRLGI